VYAYRFSERWFDIGDRVQLLEADNELRERLGMPVREAYDLDPHAGTHSSQS
jgi:NDP-sugar pyrophosphorylase family protein